MKKLVALAAAVVLALSCVGGAMAETAYLSVVNTMSGEDAAGSGFATMADDYGKQLMILCDMENDVFGIYGYNADDEGEMTVWANVTDTQNITYLYAVCLTWDAIEATLDDGFTMSVGFQFEGEELSTVTDADTAKQIVDAIEGAM